MRSNRMRVFVIGVAAATIGIYAQQNPPKNQAPPQNDQIAITVQKGAKWLASVQGKDGGWGQDGGETSYVRQGERLESSGNDVANTAVAVEALLHSGSTPTRGPYRDAVRRGIEFLLQNVEQSPETGLAVTNRQGTQIQRKLGPYIDTFLTSKLFAELDGEMGDSRQNARIRAGLQKCVAKIEKNQLKDGSWNIAGGWAPILGTSMASQSLYMARQKGAKVSADSVARVDEYTRKAATNGGVGSGRSTEAVEVAAASAGVSLYQGAQTLEQLSRTPADREKNAKEIRAVTEKLSDNRFVTGFGSMGGEEFFSYLNISDSLRRTGGSEWTRWNRDITSKIVKLQNDDGTWAGHHCITGRVAVTSAAILLLQADRDPIVRTSRTIPQ